MAKARAILKRRKAVRNIRKITKTMQMIATAKFQKSLRRAVGTKPYSRKVRELVRELAASVGNVEHPLLRRPGPADRTHRIALLVITSNRGLAGAYNGNVLRKVMGFIRQQEAAGNGIDLYITGKKGTTYFNYQRRPIIQRVDVSDAVKFAEIEPTADRRPPERDRLARLPLPRVPVHRRPRVPGNMPSTISCRAPRNCSTSCSRSPFALHFSRRISTRRPASTWREWSR